MVTRPGVDSDGDGSGSRWELSGVILVLCYLCGLVCFWLCVNACVIEDTGCNKPKIPRKCYLSHEHTHTQQADSAPSSLLKPPGIQTAFMFTVFFS